MKRILISILILVFGWTVLAQSLPRVDTLFYDSDGKRVIHKAFAEYYRIALYPASPTEKRLFRDYYDNGKLYGKGSFISIDSEDDSKSVFDGKVETYFKNGNIQTIRNYNQGLLDGECMEYFEDGLIKISSKYRDGLLSGVYTEFGEDGSYYQIEFRDGVSLHDYYVYCLPNGYIVKLKLSDNSVYWESPSPAERKRVSKNGIVWNVYSKNGITVAESYTQVNDNGKWHRIDLLISNESLVPIVFDPVNCICSYSVDLKHTPTLLSVWSSNAYIDKVKREQTWAAIAYGLAEGIATANAGYTMTESTTTTTYSGSASLYGKSSSASAAYAIGNGGSAFGAAVSRSRFAGYGQYSGNSTSTTLTRSYDATAAYQARVISQQRMTDFRNAQLQELNIKESGYLKPCTINPGEYISGYVNIERVEGSIMFNTIHIEDAAYKFDWRFGNKTGVISPWLDYLSIYANEQMDIIDILFENNNENKLSQSIDGFFTWFIKSDISDDKTVKRVLDIENKYANILFSRVEKSLNEGKGKQADRQLLEVEKIYRKFPIPLRDLHERIKLYENRTIQLLGK